MLKKLNFVALYNLDMYGRNHVLTTKVAMTSIKNTVIFSLYLIKVRPTGSVHACSSCIPNITFCCRDHGQSAIMKLFYETRSTKNISSNQFVNIVPNYSLNMVSWMHGMCSQDAKKFELDWWL